MFGSAGGISTDCTDIVPSNYHTYRCDYNSGDSSCTPKKRECNEYGQKPGDTCSELYSGVDSGKRCDFSESGTCTSYCDGCDCDDLNGKTICESNIPSDYTKKCKWIEATGECDEVPRNCEDTFQRNDENACKSRVPSDENKACIFINSLCYEKYPDCDSYTGDDSGDCEEITPFNSANNGLDYSKKCQLDNQGRCGSDTKTCEFYSLGDFSFGQTEAEKCSYAKTSNDQKYRCDYDSTTTPKCKEIERECSYYNEGKNEDDIKEEECEKIVPSNTNKKCALINKVCQEENRKCEEMGTKELCEALTLTDSHMHCIWDEAGSPKCTENYDSCESYKGKDKKTCINIVLNTPNKCFLKHDLTCIEGDLQCSLATNENECKMAKPTNPAKKCIFYNGICHEEYEKCGDYKGNTAIECSDIKLFNGKKCVYDSVNSKCKTELKKCNDALDKSECELLFKLGVADQEYYRCNFGVEVGGTTDTCHQDYMYCSDYEGETVTECEHIKPYDESGTYIEVEYKCKIKENSVKCERVLRDCTEAGTSEAKCKKISEKLELTSDKYCAFIGGTCTEQYKTCESYTYTTENSGTFETDCEEIVPKNYEKYHCEAEPVEEGSSEKQCVQKKNECKFYNSATNTNINYDTSYWTNVCTNIGELCEYSDGACSETTKYCSEMTFSSIKDENLNICKSLPVSEDYKVCTLKKDKLGCEEFNKIINTPISMDDIDKEDDDNSQNQETDTNEDKKPNNAENTTNYGGKKYGIGLIFIIISLLF